MTDEPSSNPRPPVLDDADVWSEPSKSIDWHIAYNERAEHTAELTATIDALRADLSAARYERDIWWPLGFCVGVICGIGLGVWLS